MSNRSNERQTMTRPHSAIRLALIVFALSIVFVTLPAITAARASVDIEEVTSESGVTAWLVEDHSIPIISIRFAFKGGSAQDPIGREGIANLMTGLFNEGAGELDSDAYQSRLDEVGAEMSFSAARDAIYGEMRMLADMRDESIELLALAVNEPRFDQAPLDRVRSQIVTGIVASQRNPQVQGREAFARALYGDHPYARPADGTSESLGAITAENLRAFHEANFARGNLSVAVVGAIDAQTLREELDRLFSALPQEPELAQVERVVPALAQEVNYPFALPQASVQLVFPGIERDDPEFFPAFLMNHVLGGGTFSSRLFTEVREQRGLAYGVGSFIQNLDFATSLSISTSTRSDRVEETLGVIDDVIARMIEEGPTEAELENAKTYLIGAYPINNLDSSLSIARTLVELQKDDMGIDYINRRESLIRAVTVEQAHAAARRLLEAEPALLVIGPERPVAQ
jgi:zinc protease